MIFRKRKYKGGKTLILLSQMKLMKTYNIPLALGDPTKLRKLLPIYAIFTAT